MYDDILQVKALFIALCLVWLLFPVALLVAILILQAKLEKWSRGDGLSAAGPRAPPNPKSKIQNRNLGSRQPEIDRSTCEVKRAVYLRTRPDCLRP